MQATTWEILTPDMMDKETFYNICRLADLTGYAAPHLAYRALNQNVAVWKDQCGNIVRLA